MADTLEGFPDFFRFAVWSLLNSCGGSVGSGSRTNEEQVGLYKSKGAWSPTNPGAAAPGTSHHEVGVASGAADMEGDLDCMHASAAKFGLFFPMANEPWHIEPTDELIAKGMGFFGMEGDAAAMPLDPAAPEQREDGLSRAERLLFGDDDEDEGDISTERSDAPAAATADPRVKTKEKSKPFVPAASAGFTPGGGALGATEVASFLAQAGFRSDALVTAVAVSMGESGWDPQATGDTSLTDATWGPSMGLMQIRSLNAERGTGSWRDASRLYDPVFNAKAAFAISNGGTNFGPWTVYSKGLYQKYMDQARAAVAAIGGGTGMASPLPAPPETEMEARQWDDLLAMQDEEDPTDVLAGATGDIVEGISPAAEIPTGMREREEFASA